MTVSRVLFDFNRNENYSTIDLCFHPCTATSTDQWVTKPYFAVNQLNRFFIRRNSSAYENYKYGYLRNWYINDTHNSVP